MKKIAINNVERVSPVVIPARCPHCGRESNFEGAGTDDIKGSNVLYGETTNYIIGIRRCPRSSCHGQLYFQSFSDEAVTYPVQRVDFDTSDIPKRIVSSFDEALSCEAGNLYVSSAIMVRKTLELICHDRDAKGKNLKTRIQALETQVTLPKPLFDAMDNLRLLGNDAAHVESKIFDEISKDEVILAIDLTKEILKGIYQMDSIAKRLAALKKNDDQA